MAVSTAVGHALLDTSHPVRAETANTVAIVTRGRCVIFALLSSRSGVAASALALAAVTEPRKMRAPTKGWRQHVASRPVRQPRRSTTGARMGCRYRLLS